MELATARLGSPQDNVEPDLIARAIRGDRWAFGELVRRHRQGVINIVYRMCGDANTAEDAAQEAFLRAWQHLDKYQPKASFRNWLYKIATNSAYNLLRTEKPTVDVDSHMPMDKTSGPEQSVEKEERAQLVQRAVLSLSQACRSVLILREYEGMSYREIAETLDIPVGTVMSRLNYARQALRKSLQAILEVG